MIPAPAASASRPPLPIRLLAEGVGTCLLVAIGTGAIVAGVRQGGVQQGVLAIAWFLAVSIPILLFARASGAHLNPLVSLVLALRGRFPPSWVPSYVAAQVIGALLGSALVRLLVGTDANLGATLPRNGDWLRALIGETVFTFFLLVSVLFVVERGPGPWRWRLLMPGAVVGVSTYAIGPFSGSSLNLARTIAPALLSGADADLWVYVVSAGIAGLAAVTLAWIIDPRGERPPPRIHLNATVLDPGGVTGPPERPGGPSSTAPADQLALGTAGSEPVDPGGTAARA